MWCIPEMKHEVENNRKTPPIFSDYYFFPVLISTFEKLSKPFSPPRVFHVALPFGILFAPGSPKTESPINSRRNFVGWRQVVGRVRTFTEKRQAIQRRKTSKRRIEHRKSGRHFAGFEQIFEEQYRGWVRSATLEKTIDANASWNRSVDWFGPVWTGNFQFTDILWKIIKGNFKNSRKKQRHLIKKKAPRGRRWFVDPENIYFRQVWHVWWL